MFGSCNEYVIVKYKNNTNIELFDLFYEGKKINKSMEHFDLALLTLLEYRYQGSDSTAAIHCGRLFDVTAYVEKEAYQPVIKYKGIVGRKVKQANQLYFWDCKDRFSAVQLPNENDIEQTTLDEKISLLIQTIIKDSFIPRTLHHIYQLDANGQYLIFEYEENNQLFFQAIFDFNPNKESDIHFDDAILRLLEQKYEGQRSKATTFCKRMLQMP